MLAIPSLGDVRALVVRCAGTVLAWGDGDPADVTWEPIARELLERP